MEAQRQKEEIQRRQAAVEGLAEKFDIPAPAMEKPADPEPEEKLEMSFTVAGTLAQLKSLKAYMETLGVEFK
jgi:hypothetical protein